MQSKQFPMVAEVSGENGQFKGVFRKQSGIWAEVTEEVGWIETPFSQPNRIE